MKVKMQRQGQEVSVALQGELDHHNAVQLREAVDAELLSSPVTKLSLDFSGVDFCDSSAFGFAMGRYKIVAGKGGKVEINGAKGQVLKMFKLSGAGKYININEVGEK